MRRVARHRCGSGGRLPQLAAARHARPGKSEPATTLEITLARWGIRRLGELARLDPDAIGSRLGRRGVELIRIARGENHSRLMPRRPAEVFTEAIELDYGIELLEPLGFVMHADAGAPVRTALAARAGRGRHDAVVRAQRPSQFQPPGRSRGALQ